MRPSIIICIVGCVAHIHATAETFANVAGSPEHVLSDKSAKDAREQLNQQQSSVSNVIDTLKNSPQTTNNLKRLNDFKAASEAISNAQMTINGNLPNSKFELARSLETIRTALRPVYVLCGSEPWTVSDTPHWATWQTYVKPMSEKLARVAASVGLFLKYYKQSDGSLIYGGPGASAFVVGDSYIITNRHELQTVAFKNDSGWHFKDRLALHVAFPYEYSQCSPRSKPKEVEVTEIVEVGTGPEDDYAILKTAPAQLPPPVPLASKFTLAEGALVVTFGYPERPQSCDGMDNTENNPCTYLTSKQVDFLFQAPDKGVPFPAERMSPGAILINPTSAQDTFSYDASTWGGSSGSPIVSLVDGTVVGIHYQGIGGNAENVGYNNAISATKLYAVLSNKGIIK